MILRGVAGRLAMWLGARGVANAVAGRGAMALGAVAVLFLAAPARAGTEEFSTFHTTSQEEDDESLLDHVLGRPPRLWRDEWEHAPQGIRTSQACLTSGQWMILTDMKVRSTLGQSSQLGVDLRQSVSDMSSFEYIDFSFLFPTRVGTAGAMFRPFFDKSRQDFALIWGTGADTTSFDMRAVFTVEDMFNNLWAFRQTRVGDESEPYVRHPYEPALRLRGRGDAWRAEIFGQYLTPSTKLVLGNFGIQHEATLWGTLGGASVEAGLLGFTWELRGWNQQARSGSQPVDFSTGPNDNWRRQWQTEVAVRRGFGSRLAADLRWIYQSRTETWGPPLGPGTFDGIDRLLQLEVQWDATRTLHVRAGGMHDRIGIEHTGVQPYFTWGTRVESRAYIGLVARFGRVSVEGDEGIELDPEHYEVARVLGIPHDKGVLKLQATF